MGGRMQACRCNCIARMCPPYVAGGGLPQRCGSIALALQYGSSAWRWEGGKHGEHGYCFIQGQLLMSFGLSKRMGTTCEGSVEGEQHDTWCDTTERDAFGYWYPGPGKRT